MMPRRAFLLPPAGKATGVKLTLKNAVIATDPETGEKDIYLKGKEPTVSCHKVSAAAPTSTYPTHAPFIPPPLLHPTLSLCHTRHRHRHLHRHRQHQAFKAMAKRHTQMPCVRSWLSANFVDVAPPPSPHSTPATATCTHTATPPLSRRTPTVGLVQVKPTATGSTMATEHVKATQKHEQRTQFTKMGDENFTSVADAVGTTHVKVSEHTPPRHCSSVQPLLLL